MFDRRLFPVLLAAIGSFLIDRREVTNREFARFVSAGGYTRQELWRQPVTGLFFLAANNELPMPFVQALMALGYRPVPLSGAAGEKVVDIAIQRTLVEIRQRRADVLLVSNDGDFVNQVGDLLDGRRVGVVGFQEFRSNAFLELTTQGLATFDLEYDVQAFREPLPRIRIIAIEDFDPADFL